MSGQFSRCAGTQDSEHPQAQNLIAQLDKKIYVYLRRIIKMAWSPCTVPDMFIDNTHDLI